MVKIEKLFMDGQKRFSHISPKVLNALDRDFSGWQDLVPADQTSKLNEESLINLIKDKKRAEIYRTVVDRRNALMKEAYEGSDRSFADLTKEFATFSYEQTHKWFDMEEKLSSIMLEFRAKVESVDIEGLDRGLDAVVDKVRENVDRVVNQFNNSMDNYANSFFNVDVNGASRAGSSELKSFLKTKVGQFKQEIKQAGQRQQDFVNNSLKKLIRGKLEKIKAGELDEGALNRSDLLTDEEMKSLEEAQKQVLVDMGRDRRNSNISAINEMTQKFLGVSGKSSVLQKLSECPPDIVSDEVKKYVADAMDHACLFVEDDSSSNRKPRAIADAICIALDFAAFKLSQAGDKYTAMKEDLEKDALYKFCNSGTYYTAHIFTFGFCTGYTAGKNFQEASKYGALDYSAFANILSGISFFIGLFSWKKWTELAMRLAVKVMDVGCTVTGTDLKTSVGYFCSAFFLLKNVWDLSNRSVPLTLAVAAGLAVPIP